MARNWYGIRRLPAGGKVGSERGQRIYVVCRKSTALNGNLLLLREPNTLS